jgi:predicted AAA+ superfamily ATPase
LSYSEIPNFDLERLLRFGGLPAVYQSNEPEEELDAYVSTYLYEEIQAESLVRNLPQFSRFLKTAALSSGHLLNFAQISSDAQVPASTIKEHYKILEDTLIGFMLNPWTASKKRKAIMTAKFYLFDTGVTHTLAGTKHLDRNSDLYGRSFEQWIGLELTSYLNYRRKKDALCFWRSAQGHEVDFIVGDHTAIEVKATKSLTKTDFSGLKALAEEKVFRQLLMVSQDKIETQKNGIRAVHWKTFMEQLWSGNLF